MKYILNGRVVSKEEFDAAGVKDDSWLLPAGKRLPHTYEIHHPLVSEGLGVMKAQVPEMREVIKRHNIQGVNVRENGSLEITSRRGRRELMKVRGLADADAGYSD